MEWCIDVSTPEDYGRHKIFLSLSFFGLNQDRMTEIKHDDKISPEQNSQ